MNLNGYIIVIWTFIFLFTQISEACSSATACETIRNPISKSLSVMKRFFNLESFAGSLILSLIIWAIFAVFNTLKYRRTAYDRIGNFDNFYLPKEEIPPYIDWIKYANDYMSGFTDNFLPIGIFILVNIIILFQCYLTLVWFEKYFYTALDDGQKESSKVEDSLKTDDKTIMKPKKAKNRLSFKNKLDIDDHGGHSVDNENIVKLTKFKKAKRKIALEK